MNEGMKTVPNFSQFIGADSPLGHKVEITVSSRKPGAVRVVMADLGEDGHARQAVMAELTVEQAIQVQHTLLSAINTAVSKTQKGGDS